MHRYAFEKLYVVFIAHTTYISYMIYLHTYEFRPGVPVPFQGYHPSSFTAREVTLEMSRRGRWTCSSHPKNAKIIEMMKGF